MSISGWLHAEIECIPNNESKTLKLHYICNSCSYEAHSKSKLTLELIWLWPKALAERPSSEPQLIVVKANA